MWHWMPFTVSTPDSEPRRRSDHVAEGVDRRRFADDAEIDAFAACLQGFDDGDRAVGGVAFFIGGEQEAERAGKVRMSGEKGFDRRDRRGQRGFHVGRTAPVEHAVADFRAKGGEVHLSSGPVGNDVGMAGKTNKGAWVPRRAHRLVTPLRLMYSSVKPSGFRRAPMISMHPPSSGVTGDRR